MPLLFARPHRADSPNPNLLKFRTPDMKLLSLLSLLLPLLTACTGGNRPTDSACNEQPDSLVVMGQVDAAYLPKADSAAVFLRPLAVPPDVAQSGRQDDYFFALPMDSAGHFSGSVPLYGPSLCLLHFGTPADTTSGAAALFFFHPGDTLTATVRYDGTHLLPTYHGATPYAPLSEFLRAEAYFRDNYPLLSAYSLPDERNRCLLTLDSLHRARIRLRLAMGVDVFLQLQLNVAALNTLATAPHTPPHYFDFLRYMDLGNPLCYSTRFFYPAFRRLLENEAFPLPDARTTPPARWEKRARVLLSPYIEPQDSAFYSHLRRIARQ